ncbi:MAG: hypothetical protein M1834_006727 [Cirrosporium novae-zelandiae]|nr:MAG: hypothetical protein M1834_006727 [Cirrosporium novae-zelandiae]
MKPSKSRLVHTRKRKRVENNPNLVPIVERTNALTLEQLKINYLPDGSSCLKYRRDNSKKTWLISLETSKSISDKDLDACLQIIESTSVDAYRRSELGWHPAEKKKEMQLPDMRYLLVREANSEGHQNKANQDSIVNGFLSFMVTYEDGKEVIYCYEVHLSEELRGIKLGKHLMMIMEQVGTQIKLEKAMLTVFVKNEQARKFYEKIGYDVDEYSPQPKKLRGGVIKEPSYVILSKPLKASKGQ